LGRNIDILNEASYLDDPYERQAWVACFILSFFGDFQYRVNKPANPLSGETFEFAGRNWEAVTEQVSHHPPITALYIKSEKSQLHANSDMRLAFWGKTIEVTLNALCYIDLINEEKGINERYEANFLKNSVNNLIFGKAMNFTHFGDMVCRNMQTDEKCTVKVNGSSGLFMRDKDKCKIMGFVIPKG
jgi:hypothetical protein